MSLLFGAATSDRVIGTNFGTNPTVWTCYWWHNLNTLTNDKRFFGKTGSGTFTIQLAAAGDASRLRMLIDYTTDSSIIGAGGEIVVGVRQFVALTGNHTTSAPRAFIGGLTKLPQEITYGTQSTPTGTRTTDGGAVYCVGNASAAGTNAIQGEMESFAFINGSALSLPEITRHWEATRYGEMAPLHPHTRVLLSLGEFGTGTQIDLSGNGNHGTVTGATAAAWTFPTRPRRRLFYDAPAAGGTRQILVGRRASLAGPGGFAA